MSITEAIGRHKFVAVLDKGLLNKVAVVCSLSLVILAAIAALILVQRGDSQIADISRTYEVRNQARELANALSQAQSSQRGYGLTLDDSFTQPYRQALSDVQTSLLSLVALTRSDQQQAATVAGISADIELQVAEMSRALDATSGMDSAGSIATAPDARLRVVEAALEHFISEENQKLLDRNRQIDLSKQWLVGSIICALAAAMILTYLLYVRSRREVSELAHSKDLLHGENSVLEAHVLDRNHALDDARQHAEQERLRVETLLQDANHRIGNSLATVSSLLGLQLIRSKSDEVRDALEAARSRVHAIASAHRRLRLGNDLETASADEFLQAVVDDIALNAVDSRGVAIKGVFEPILVSARDATTIGILVAELVTNALKHGFPNGREGSVVVELRADEAGLPTLSVVDDGVGLSPDKDPAEGGLGSVVVQQLSNQFGGKPKYAPTEGGGLTVLVPLPALAAGKVV